MVAKSIRRIKFTLKFSQVFVNIRTQFVSNVDVLSLNIGRGFSWKLSWWMRLTHVASEHEVDVVDDWKWKNFWDRSFWFFDGLNFHVSVWVRHWLKISASSSQVFWWDGVRDIPVHLSVWMRCSGGHWSLNWRGVGDVGWNWTRVVQLWFRSSFS